MAAYVIGDIGEIRNQEAYAQYRAQVLATIERYGGRFLVRGGAHETLEGKWRPGRVVIIEFPDVAAAKRWHGSADYAPLLKLRQSASEGSLVVVAGV